MANTNNVYHFIGYMYSSINSNITVWTLITLPKTVGKPKQSQASVQTKQTKYTTSAYLTNLIYLWLIIWEHENRSHHYQFIKPQLLTT